jgi:hypothetical protein
MNALITNRLFYLSQRTKDDVHLDKNATEKTLQDLKFRKMKTGEIRLDFPRYIDLEYLRYTICRCFCMKKNKTFSKYQELVSIASEDFIKDLDLVRMVRRQRLTAISLFFLQSA